MPRKSKPQKLSEGEMEIMNLLWQKGALSISEAHAQFDRPIGYTTIQTRLNRLVEKKFVRKTADRPAKYEATLSPHDVSEGHLDQLIENVAQGSVVPLVAQLLSNRKFTETEIAELKSFIENAETE